MIRVVQFHHEHLKLFTPTRIFMGETSDGQESSNSGYAHTILNDDTLIGCVGGVVVWKGVAEVWCCFSEAIHQNPLAVTRTIHDFLGEYRTKLNLHRIQAYVRVGYPMAKRWAESLGFVEEGILKGMGVDKGDYYMMAQVVK
jgi:RimJ/RimL family protein N-acetyltransferase